MTALAEQETVGMIDPFFGFWAVQQPSPSLQISLPTNALRDLAKHILEILNQPDAQAAIVQGAQSCWSTV